jgi:hypothetical protein
VPFLKKLHEEWLRGEVPDLPIAPETYLAQRAAYRQRAAADLKTEPGTHD